LLVFIFTGSAETYDGQGGKLHNDLMASCLRNICTENLKFDNPSSSCSRKCSGCFFETQCATTTTTATTFTTTKCVVACSQYCAEANTVECVCVHSADGRSIFVYPELSYRTETVSVDVVKRGIGIHESAERIASLLTRMCLQSVVTDDGEQISVEVNQITQSK